MSRGLTSAGLRTTGGHICHLVPEDATEKPCNGGRTDARPGTSGRLRRQDAARGLCVAQGAVLSVPPVILRSERCRWLTLLASLLGSPHSDPEEASGRLDHAHHDPPHVKGPFRCQPRSAAGREHRRELANCSQRWSRCV